MVLFQRHVWLSHLTLNQTNSQRLLLFLVFFPRSAALPTQTTPKQPTWRTALTIALLCLFHGLIIVFISAWLLLSKPHHLSLWANVLGIMSASLAAIQYLPQIWTTWHLGHVGSLSIPMMVIQTPGSFVWAASLAARLGVQGWSTWGVFLVTGALQGCLLGMGLWFEVQNRRSRKVADEVNVSTIQEVAARGKQC